MQRVGVLVFLCLFFACGLVSAQSKTVIISTNMGDIKIMLYDDTPKHRDSFIKLANQGHYDGTLFYRVLKNFVVQGGSSDSKNAPVGKHIGYGSSKLTIDSEFRENRIHKKGALCAPRQPGRPLSDRRLGAICGLQDRSRSASTGDLDRPLYLARDVPRADPPRARARDRGARGT